VAQLFGCLLVGTLVLSWGLAGRNLRRRHHWSLSVCIPAFEVQELGFRRLADLASPLLRLLWLACWKPNVHFKSRCLSKSGQDISKQPGVCRAGRFNVGWSFFHLPIQVFCLLSRRAGSIMSLVPKHPLSAIFSGPYSVLNLVAGGTYFAYVPIPPWLRQIILVAWKLIDFARSAHIFTTSKDGKLDWPAWTFVFSSLAIDL